MRASDSVAFRSLLIGRSNGVNFSPVNEEKNPMVLNMGSSPAQLQNKMNRKNVAMSGKNSFVLSSSPTVSFAVLNKNSMTNSTRFWNFPGTSLTFLEKIYPAMTSSILTSSAEKKLFVTG